MLRHHSYIPTRDLEMAEGMRAISRLLDASIEKRMFPPNKLRILRELREETDFGGEYAYETELSLRPLKRLLDPRDARYLSRVLPEYRSITSTIHRDMLLQYSDAIEDDLAGRKEIPKWQVFALVYSLRSVVTLHALGCARAHSLLRWTVAQVEGLRQRKPVRSGRCSPPECEAEAAA